MAFDLSRGVSPAAFAAVLLVAGALPAAASKAAPVTMVAAAPSAAEFASHRLASLRTIDGQPVELSAGQGPLLLQFWASWCHSCGGLMWELDGLSAAHPQVRYFAVSIDDEHAEAARITTHALYARRPSRFLHDHEGALARRMDIQVVPALVLLDAEGKERLRHVGHVNSTDLQRLRRALAEVSTTSPLPETTP